MISFGLNVDLIDNTDLYARITDSMKDYNGIIECGAEILSTKISRTISLDKKLYNIDFLSQGKALRVHINEHHEGHIKKEEFPDFSLSYIKKFLENCWTIVENQGYTRSE